MVEYPIEPFVQWIETLVDQAKRDRPAHVKYGNQHDPNGETAIPPVALVAHRLGVERDTLQKWRKRRAGWIDERTVDAVVSNEGSVTIGDIYPSYRTRPTVVTRQHQTRRPAPRTKVKRYV